MCKFLKNKYFLIFVLLCIPAILLLTFRSVNNQRDVLGIDTSRYPYKESFRPNFTCGLPFYRDNGCPCKVDNVCKSNNCSDSRCSEEIKESEDKGLKCDYNGDGFSTVSDYTVFISELNDPPEVLKADCNKNGEIDVFDYILWLEEFYLSISN